MIAALAGGSNLVLGSWSPPPPLLQPYSCSTNVEAVPCIFVLQQAECRQDPPYLGDELRLNNYSMGWIQKEGARLVAPTLMYWRMAVAGQIELPVRPITVLDPEPYWSHLNFFRWNWIMRVLLWLSTATSPHAKPVDKSKDTIESGRSSFRRKNPKNTEEAITHRTTLSGVEDASRDD